jgi:ferric-dicitrate binding protein FerR (iron transport regulator)
MIDDEHRFEQYLRGFEPVAPRPLPSAARAGYASRRIAAAAVAAAVIGLLLWIGPEPKRARDSATTGASGDAISAATLARIALDDQKLFDIRIDASAPTVMRCCQGRDSSLAALAKD